MPLLPLPFCSLSFFVPFEAFVVFVLILLFRSRACSPEQRPRGGPADSPEADRAGAPAQEALASPSVRRW